VTDNSFRLGKWHRSTRSGDYRIAEGGLIFAGLVSVTVILHRRDEKIYWVTFPRSVAWTGGRNALHRLVQALVKKLKAQHSELFWPGVDRATPADRAELQGRVRQYLHQGGRP
jgi:hypothetical protein